MTTITVVQSGPVLEELFVTPMCVCVCVWVTVMQVLEEMSQHRKLSWTIDSEMFPHNNEPRERNFRQTQFLNQFKRPNRISSKKKVWYYGNIWNRLIPRCKNTFPNRKERSGKVHTLQGKENLFFGGPTRRTSLQWYAILISEKVKGTDKATWRLLSKISPSMPLN